LLELNNLIWRHFWKNLELSKEVVYPSIPIMYFGDRNAYEKSKIRIVTVGLNPSYNEFPTNSPFKRFPKAANLLNNKGFTPNIEIYQESLNDYFTENADPYRRWFNSFEPILNGLNSSFYHGRPNVALHTDLCTPLATKTTWSDLKKIGMLQGWVRTLEREGNEIWHSLMYELKPDIMLVSVARDYLKSIRLAKKTPWSLLDRIEFNSKGERRNPYEFTRCIVDLKGKEAHLIFGRAAQTPFSLISDQQKRSLGQKILHLSTLR
jgi:hypothetical protein